MTINDIRARFDHDTIRVYQAYRRDIAHAALNAGTFVAPFSMTRMTWIKPSFNWMMYRCGHASKEDQEVVLAVDRGLEMCASRVRQRPLEAVARDIERHGGGVSRRTGRETRARAMGPRAGTG